MRRESYGVDNDDRLVFVLGWGNRPEFDNVRWLVDRLVDAGYRVDVFQIPPHIRDYEAAWLDPILDYVDDLDAYRCLSNSTGGLISRFLPAEGLESRVYLSPWWGVHPALRGPMVDVLASTPVTLPVVPTLVDGDALGGLATDEQVRATPGSFAPTFVREARKAQRAMPPFDDRDVVFYAPDDPVVGVDAIEAQVPDRNRVAYDGGHELFSSRSRRAHLDALLAAVRDGVDGIAVP
jgi:hypothetical protein